MKISQGFSLIELMLALTISIFILSIIVEIYLAAEKSFATQSDLSDIQEHARIAIQLLNSDIKLAGYIGCAKLTDDFPVKSIFPYKISAANKIIIHKINNSDVLTIQHASLPPANLIEPMKNELQMIATVDPHFSKGDWLLISDCQSAELFQVKQVLVFSNKQILIATGPLSRLYDQAAEVSRWEINTYFVSNTMRKTNQGKEINALYVTHIDHQKLELVEGVDKMKIKLVAPEENGISIAFTFVGNKLIKNWYLFESFLE